MKRLACALVFAGAVCALLTMPQESQAARKRVASDLRLSLLTPDPAEISDRASLDVSFRDGAVDSVELYLDNALVAKRQLNSTQTRGVITFTLDVMLLAEGSHDVRVVVTSPGGKVTTAAGKLRIPAADLSAPVRIAYPTNGMQVSGTVPIRVALDEQMLRARPYVTFFVDKELQVLRNYPPYEYMWDTTRVLNGWHLLEAWTQMDGAAGPTKARPVNVNVNNATGATQRMNQVPDLREPQKSRPIVLKPGDEAKPLPPAQLGGSTTLPGVTGRTRDMSLGVKPVDPGAIGRLTSPSRVGLARTSAAVNRPVHGAAAAVAAPRPAARMAGGAISRPSGKLATRAASRPPQRVQVAQAPKPTLPPLAPPEPVFAVAAPATAAVGNLLMAVRPGDTLETVSRRSGISARELARLNNLRPNAALKPGKSLVVPGTGSFDVAFNGQRVVFDVMPRVADGVRLAPFRHIFEHTGGKVRWYNEAKTVRAINPTREIEIKVGNQRARVNNETVLVERVPFLESGRTIVPLSFVRDALDVRVSFDARSGRLLIEGGK